MVPDHEDDCPPRPGFLTMPALPAAISDAGITKQTLYEVEKNQFTHTTYDRAMESLNSVNGEIPGLVQKSWGR